MRAVVQLGQLDRFQRGGRLRGPPSAAPRSRRRPAARSPAPISSLLIARVGQVGDPGAVAAAVVPDVPGHGDLAGGRGRDVAAVGSARVGLQPAAVHEQRGAVGGDQRYDHVDALGAVAVAVADHDRLRGVVGPGRADHPPLVLRRRGRAPGLSTSPTGATAAVLVGRAPRCSRPCGRPGGGTATRRATTRRTPAPPRRARTGSSAGSAGTGTSARREATQPPAANPLKRRVGHMQPLADAYGRVATDLRVSLTDRCNLRCTYCMPEEGLDWLPLDAAAHRRRGGPADHRRRGAAGRARGPVHRRRAAGPPRAGRHRPSYGGPRAAPRDLADHQRARPGQDRGRARGGGARPGQRQPRHDALRHVPRDHPARPVRRRGGRARGRPGRRAGAGQGQRRPDARRQRRPGSGAARRGASSAATRCGSSSRCRWTPSTAGAATR